MNLTKKAIVFAVTFVFIISMVSTVFAATHTYNFDSRGGTPSTIPSMTKEDGESLDIPEVTKNGSTFGGWYYEDETMPIDAPGRYVPFEGEAKVWHPATVNLFAKWVTSVDTINITVDLPVGSSVSAGSLAESAVTVPSGAKYAAFPEGAGVIKGYDDDSAYEGTIEEGKDYYVELWVSPNGGVFTSSTTIKVNGTSNYKIGDFYVDANGKLDPTTTEYGFLMYAKVTAGATSSDNENEDATINTNEATTTDETSSESTTEASTNSSTLTNPSTGDNIVAYVSMAIISIVALGGIIAYRKLKK